MASRICARESGDRRGHAFTLLELLVAMAILLILAGVVFGVARAFHLRSLERITREDIGALEMGLAQYRRDWGAYPPDDIAAAGGAAPNAMNEALVHFLCRRIIRSASTYGPYADIGKGRFADSDTDGFLELRDPYGNLYEYAENASHSTPTGANPRSYDIVSPGHDGALGGTISPATGYVPAATPAAKALEEDNVTSWGK
ncbi:MAG: prepilin-type N-terminal cleavage/methylation domain-containing protein [Planctomycetota bacterium]|jgi:prepilin-type N-terminal cleavage/methylation domain-containing protein